MSTIRVLHCPNGVGGNAWALSRGERELGLVSDVMVFSDTWPGYPHDINLRLSDRGRVGKALALSSFFVRAVRDYDVIHFNFGESLFSRLPGPLAWLTQKDLALFKALGKRICVTYQGCDVRQKTYCVANMERCACAVPDCYGGHCTPEVDAVRAHRAAVFDRYADAIFALNPDLLRVLPARARFLPYTTIDPHEWTPSDTRSPGTGAKFTILHAPTNHGAKGTRFVLEAVERLRARRPEVELLLVENVPHAQVRAYYERADLLVDQLLVGWYGGLAVELMALGVPAVAYLREEDLRYVPEPMRSAIPVVNATPDTLLEVLDGLVENRSELAALGARSRDYVLRFHDPRVVATQTRDVYEQLIGAPES